MPQIAIIGAGLAGLRCAQILNGAGYEVTLFEGRDRPGGRVATTMVDGFRLDRGFQVLLTAYPEAEAAYDYEALRLRDFDAGALIWTGHGFEKVMDPLRHPRALWSTLTSPVASFPDKLRTAWLRIGVTWPTLEEVMERKEVTTLQALTGRWGFSDTMITRFFRPFLSGITLDPALSASSRQFEFTFRMFALGRAAVPADGMQQLAHELVRGLPDDAIRYGTEARRLDGTVIHLAHESTTAFDAVVVATPQPLAYQLLGIDREVHHRSVHCHYFAAPRPPYSEPLLALNGTGVGPVNNLAVMTNVAPSYGDGRRALVSASVLENHADATPDDVRFHLREWFGDQVGSWEHLETVDVRYALPDQAPPFVRPEASPRHDQGQYLCGDYLGTASLNGALGSGRRAAEAIMQDLPL